MEDSLKGKLFEKVKNTIRAHSKGQDIRTDSEKAFHVYGTTEVLVGKKKVQGQYFASSQVLTSSIGFYFFPIYTHKDEFDPKDYPNLIKTLKGKSCFHIKKDEPELFSEMEKMLQRGAILYDSLGWR